MAGRWLHYLDLDHRIIFALGAKIFLEVVIIKISENYY